MTNATTALTSILEARMHPSAKVIQELYFNPKFWDERKINEELLSLELHITRMILSAYEDRPIRFDLLFNRELFDENPKDPALRGCVGYRVWCSYRITDR